MNNSYPDTNGNGVSDAFENRSPISEILNAADTKPDAAIAGGAYIEADEDRAYWVWSEKGALLLEVRGGGSLKCGACVFRSAEDVAKFLGEMQRAARHAFAV